MDSEVSGREFEVRCYRCNTSFAAGTRECIHCGERLGRPPVELVYGSGEAEAAPEEAAKNSPFRVVLWVASAIVAVMMSVARACEG